MTLRLAKSFINGITISGGDIYVIGAERNHAGKLVAKYWKNGSEIILSDQADVAQVNAIQVVDDTVYAAGYEYNVATAVHTAIYWKDGERIVITDNAENAYLNGVTVINDDVYLVGSAYIDGFSRPMIWKNGKSTRFDVITPSLPLYQ